MVAEAWRLFHACFPRFSNVGLLVVVAAAVEQLQRRLSDINYVAGYKKKANLQPSRHARKNRGKFLHEKKKVQALFLRRTLLLKFERKWLQTLFAVFSGLKYGLTITVSLFL